MSEPTVTPVAPAIPAPVVVQPVAGIAVGPHGFPESTPLAEMTIEQQAAYHRHWNRQNRTALEAAQAEIAALKPKADQFAAIEAASRTEQERAVEVARTEAATAARAEGETAAAAKYVTPLVQSRFESVLAGRLDAAAVATLVGGLNVAAFLGADGLPDTEKVTAFAATVAPAGPVVPPPPVPPINLGAGRTPPVTTGIDGSAAYERRHGRKPPA